MSGKNWEVEIKKWYNEEQTGGNSDFQGAWATPAAYPIMAVAAVNSVGGNKFKKTPGKFNLTDMVSFGQEKLFARITTIR